MKLKLINSDALLHFTAKASDLHKLTEQALAKMHEDYHASELNGDPNQELPSYEKVRKIYELMYDSFQAASDGSATKGGYEADDLDSVDLEGSMSMGYDEYGSMSMGSMSMGSMSMGYEDGMCFNANRKNIYVPIISNTYPFLFLDGSRNSSSRRDISEDEALLFINGRMTENDWSATFK